MEANQTAVALSKLNVLKQNKIHLERLVFFVPGWTDESCAWWQEPHDSNQSIKQWLSQVADNPELAQYVDFTQETKQCKSFLDFGEVLRNKVWAAIGKDQPFDLVGHSMGGLDIRAAITQGSDPLLKCNFCVTVATPNWGDNLGGVESFLMTHFSKEAEAIKPMEPYHLEQGKNLDPDYQPIKTVNSLDNRRLLLSRVNKFYELKGTQDLVVQGSAFMDMTGIKDLYKEKVVSYAVDGCEHTGIKGITLDPRTVLAVVNILCNIEIKLGFNYGDLSGGVYTPPDDKDVFI